MRCWRRGGFRRAGDRWSMSSKGRRFGAWVWRLGLGVGEGVGLVVVWACFEMRYRAEYVVKRTALDMQGGALRAILKVCMVKERGC